MLRHTDTALNAVRAEMRGEMLAHKEFLEAEMAQHRTDIDAKVRGRGF